MSNQEQEGKFNRVTIIGTGMMGCSVACLVKGKGLADEVVGVDKDQAHLEMARQLGFIDRGLDQPARGVMGAEVVVIATAMPEVYQTMEAIGPDLRPQALLTCLAGTPPRVRKQIASDTEGTKNYVPGFPLVATAARGPATAAPSVLTGKVCLLSAAEDIDAGVIERAREFWSGLGMTAQVLAEEDFAWSIASAHYWPRLIAAAVDSVTATENWPRGDSLLKHLLDACGSQDEDQRSMQLQADKLRQLMDRLAGELAKMQKVFGTSVADAKIATEGEAKNERK